MQLNREDIIKKAQKYADLIRQYVDAEKIVLYGSFAKGNGDDNSDIDIAIIVNSIDDDYLSVSALLNRLTRNVDFRIEPVLLDANDDRSGFLSSVLLTGIILYDKNQTTKSVEA